MSQDAYDYVRVPTRTIKIPFSPLNMLQLILQIISSIFDQITLFFFFTSGSNELDLHAIARWNRLLCNLLSLHPVRLTAVLFEK